jgi:flagellar export protein FliJ
MRRFSSPLIRVRDVCRQQCQMAELELARCIAARSQATEQVSQAELQVAAAQAGIREAFQQSNPSIFLQNMLNHLAGTQDQLQLTLQQLQAAEQTVQTAQEHYQTARSKVDRLDRLLETQRADHRQKTLLAEQNVISDTAVFRWNGPEPTEVQVTSHD